MTQHITRILLAIITFVILISDGFSTCQAQEAASVPERIEHLQQMVINLDDEVKLHMVYLRGGSYEMGQTETEKQMLIKEFGEAVFAEKYQRELPRHSVELDGFWIGKFEITQAQYKAITQMNPSHFQGLNRPVEQVSWNDAMDFCRALSEKTGLIFTLPTEAQWEYACRAGTTSFYAFGDCLSMAEANFDINQQLTGCEKADYRGETWNVGQGKPNAWGLFDMHGNVSELCLDWYDADYYSQSPTKNPTGPAIGNARIDRGGCWNSPASYCRSGRRTSFTPGGRNNGLGFRVIQIHNAGFVE